MSEGIRKYEIMDRLDMQQQLQALQADHATLLGLAQALPYVKGVLGVRVAEVELGDMWAITVDGYFDGNSALFETEIEANAYMALLNYRASLPAQPAQGGELCTYCKLPLTENHSFSYGFPGVSRVYRCDRPSCVKPNAEGETRA